ncbi:hypothetical protein [Spirillospora sp. NPDC029432]|uniref:hypothetical protein n=1 Tax=Spirillospora sp. NPDC029432 TaxID=3154599 RepID=UPI0034545719
MTSQRLPRDDLAAALAARRELGPDYDDAFIETLAERIDEQLAARAAARGPRPGVSAPPRPRTDRSPALAIVSLLAAIPLSAIAAEMTGMPGLITVWVAIVLVNIVHAWRP